MLLLHQSGSVKIGEIVRYTVTYTPAHDRILPSPPKLYLKVKNTSTIALRAAFVHGPYTLYAAAYPSTFNPNEKFENPRRFGVPEFEPNLKAGGVFSTELLVPEDVQRTAGTSNRDGRPRWPNEGEVKSVSWIIEVTSQVIFSISAAVRYEIMLARDEKSLALGFVVGGGTSHTPGQVSDYQQSQEAKDGDHGGQTRGIYSRAIKLRVDDTASLWNIPKMPEWDDAGKERAKRGRKDTPVESVTGEQRGPDIKRQERQKRVHLVVLTHGLHSNLGADMLYLKEHIDATAKQAKIDARARRAKRKQKESQTASGSHVGNDQHSGTERKTDGESVQVPAGQPEDSTDLDDEEEEDIIVRGFSGNAVRTEKGIKYLGKRLAKYVLAMTYPDQPYRPVTKKANGDALSHALRPDKLRPDGENTSSHHHSSVQKEPYNGKKLAYRITSISFIAHSLGGLIQTYAIAYVQKHSPQFFDIIKPINFIALATPFLGLSNENPLYVKFALDFGLVGRTGQDLGLTWRAPTLARSGWDAIVSSMSEGSNKNAEVEESPESKPLLRILPTGPAHTALKKFRNRTVYSNVVNDGIVPLRTSCLLFLDWQGLGRVEKARRENGLVGTMAEWGWAEITGQNSVSPMRHTISDEEFCEDPGENTPTRQGHGGDVPQPPPSATHDDDSRSLRPSKKVLPQSAGSSTNVGTGDVPNPTQEPALPRNSTPLASLIGLFRPNASPKQHNQIPKNVKIYKRSQTIKSDSNSSVPTNSTADSRDKGGKATTGFSDHEYLDQPPPTTTFFESAGDVLKPPLPSLDFLLNPSSRPRTIFHDRVYHPEDIPPPPLKRRATSSLLTKRRSSPNGIADNASQSTLPHQDSTLSSRDYDDTKNTNPDKDPREVVDGSAMKVEEKIARAYHRDLSWRKVLVRLEPDAHNNMIVRRMFANAYGWPVVKHICDTHFSDATVATTPDDDEGSEERAKDEDEGPDPSGSETKDAENVAIKPISRSDRTNSEIREATDKVSVLNLELKPNALRKVPSGEGIKRRPTVERSRTDQETWNERYWADSADETDEDETVDNAKRKSGEVDAQAKSGGWTWTEAIAGKGASQSPKGIPLSEIDKFLKSGVPTKSSDLQVKSDATAERSDEAISNRPDNGK